MFLLRGIYYLASIVTVAMALMIFIGPIGSYMKIDGIMTTAIVTFVFALVALAMRGIIHIFETKMEVV